MLHRKKGRTECGNYRGTSLVTDAGKVLLNVLANRPGSYWENVGMFSYKRCGFRARNIPLSTYFIDSQKPYASGDRAKFARLGGVVSDDASISIAV